MTDELSDVYYVTTSDGVLFRCQVQRIGGKQATITDHWIFQRADGAQFVGPPASLARTGAALGELVEGWWRDKKASGYANLPPRGRVTPRAGLIVQDD